MKKLLLRDSTEEVVALPSEGDEPRQLEAGTHVVLGADGRLHRVTRAGDRFLVNGNPATLALADPRDRRRKGGTGGEAGQRNVKAAMPGKVVRVLAAPGDEVTAGQGLLILEAMKMQNEVRAPRDGRVATVTVSEGATVASGQVLVTLE